MKINKLNNQTCFFNEANFLDSLFDVQFLENNNLIIGSSSGRGTTWFFEYQQKKYVLRHYYRGGLVGKINADYFLYQGLNKTRAYQEYSLLDKMLALNLPVPLPYAGRITRYGLCYRADLIIELIDGAQDLVALLGEGVLTDKQWFEVGRVIRLFHDNNIYHSDMNSHNIMLDKAGKVWLIDFDKCSLRKSGTWKEQTLARLLRSFEKEKGLNGTLNWQPHEWGLLMQGYKASADYV